MADDQPVKVGSPLTAAAGLATSTAGKTAVFTVEVVVGNTSNGIVVVVVGAAVVVGGVVVGQTRIGGGTSEQEFVEEVNELTKVAVLQSVSTVRLGEPATTATWAFAAVGLMAIMVAVARAENKNALSLCRVIESTS